MLVHGFLVGINRRSFHWRFKRALLDYVHVVNVDVGVDFRLVVVRFEECGVLGRLASPETCGWTSSHVSLIEPESLFAGKLFLLLDHVVVLIDGTEEIVFKRLCIRFEKSSALDRRLAMVDAILKVVDRGVAHWDLGHVGLSFFLG